jgi:EAL domain-containing protein (putative c-di-GMP-specific phosphodiesterase class I)
MTRPILHNGRELVVTCSLGISIYPDDDTRIENLIQNADTAMYRAKQAGRNSFQLYSPEMNAHSLDHLAMEVALRKALVDNELTVCLQPLIDARSETVASAEALLRWESATLGAVLPRDFIPLAEDTGLITPIGEFVLRSVCCQLKSWNEQGYDGVPIAVNVSAVQFRSKHFVDNTRALLDEYAIRPGQLSFELTESMLVDDAVENIRTMNALREMGICLAVDDFGTGYSSLNYLRRFPIDTLKIDRAFIRDIDTNAEAAALVEAVIRLGHSLGLKVVGEGVERKAQLRLLQGYGCDLIQGFHYSKALDGTLFERQYLLTAPVGA